MVYLDNSATTPLCAEARKAITDMMENNFGNPSSGHGVGLRAQEALEGARNTIARKLGAQAQEIYFTSGGTEANNLALFGTAEAALKFRGRKKIVTSLTEHASVYESAKELEKRGYDVVFLKPDRYGNISAEQIYDAVDEETILVSLMLVNNELGAKLPTQSVKGIIKAKNSPALFHCDCVQAFCKEKFTTKSLGADLVSVTAHKIFGPKGCGALYVKNGVRIRARLFGGEQEKKLRPGTQATLLAAGFAAAAENFDTADSALKVRELNAYAREELGKLNGIVFNSDENASDYIVNFSLPSYRSETLLNFLSERQIYVSAGSACAKGNLSHVLKAVTSDTAVRDSALRVSFSPLNEKRDIDKLCAALGQALNNLETVN